MERNTIIRDGTAADAECVRSIAFPVLQSFGIKPEPNGLDFELGHFGESYSGCIAQLVAVKGSRIVGSIVLRYFIKNDGKITGFYIDPNYQGQSIGQLLLKEAINRAKKAKLDGIVLETLDKMEVAVNLYKKFGWKEIEPPPKSSGADKKYYLKL